MTLGPKSFDSLKVNNRFPDQIVIAASLIEMTTKITLSFILAHLVSCAALFVIVKAAIGFADITDALAFYGVYHREPWNQFIHFFGVPGIIYSGVMFLVHLKIPIIGDNKTIQKCLPERQQLTYGLVLSLFYAAFYLKIDPLGGALYAPIIYAMYSSSVYFQQKDFNAAGGTSWSGTGQLLKYTFLLHIFSWYIQIHFGHKIIEGAQPAVMQSIGGALTAAPLFAFYEGLWLIGINKELQVQTLLLVEQHTLALCSAGNIRMRICENLPLN